MRLLPSWIKPISGILIFWYGIKSFALSMIETINVLSWGQLTGDEINVMTILDYD